MVHRIVRIFPLESLTVLDQHFIAELVLAETLHIVAGDLPISLRRTVDHPETLQQSIFLHKEAQSPFMEKGDVVGDFLQVADDMG